MSWLCRRSFLLGATAALSATAAIAADRETERKAMIQTMAEDRFWSLIEATLPFKDDQTQQAEMLMKALLALPPADIVAFDVAFRAELIRAYRWDLWGAAFVIHGGASDDSFEYFRRWLVAQGRVMFEQVLANPDSLADLIPEDAFTTEFEEFGYVALEAWSKITGKDYGEFGKDAIYPNYPNEPVGMPFEEDESHLAKRYPKLWARFGDNPLY